MKRINDALNTAGVWITKAVGTMWCAVIFAALALVSLPGALASGNVVVIIGWIAQTFLQLVLLSVIMVGQSNDGDTTRKLIQETHDATIAEHADTQEILRDIRTMLNKQPGQ
ncbi:MAG TPA: hypothetical protein VFU07_02125 [Candidatus Lumbricidophila sp.]|nr:hypothetical protein [Candidatus Lumbricidophila sp.]